ncbi:excisionase [Prauserella coralliicola]|nr:excisionase [Prauserella coralliicola]
MATAQELSQLATTLAKLAETIAEREAAPAEPAPPRPTPERIMLTAEEAADRLGIGRTLMYRLIRNGEVESVRIGRLRRVPASAVQDYATRLVTGTATRTAA